MALFAYIALDATGRQLTGTIPADNRAEAMDHVISRGLSPIEVNEEKTAAAMVKVSTSTRVSQSAVESFTRELAIEWAPYGIRVNAIQPCQVRTPALQALIDDPQFDSESLVGTFLHGIPLGRLAETPDIANAALFLASDAASMITGVLLPVDGGNLAMNAGGTVRW